jgi:hypothetical protein
VDAFRFHEAPAHVISNGKIIDLASVRKMASTETSDCEARNNVADVSNVLSTQSATSRSGALERRN